MTKDPKTLEDILAIIDDLNHLSDINEVLDSILFQARKLSHADAGTIYLLENNKLVFSYVHNETLFTTHSDQKYIYASRSLPIDKNSIVGFCALTGKTLVIDDVYKDENLPFTFNHSFDDRSGYRTKSMLVIPLKSFQNKLVGILQLINAKDEQGQVVPFHPSVISYIKLFANRASELLYKALCTRDLILRMGKMVEIHDTFETGAHVIRVGSFAAEIYHKWALNQNITPEEIKITKDSLRLAAMLHDAGKVGISDLILKKPGPLTEEEFNRMKMHTVLGAQLFKDGDSRLDKMCFNITLSHHERWDGLGYPGKVQLTPTPTTLLPGGKGKKGTEIPLEARITAIADVYDALSSKRCYKQAWDETKIVRYFREQAGKQFDPELIGIFLEIHEVLLAIKDKFKD